MKRITTLTVMLVFISLIIANELFPQRGNWGRSRRCGRGRGMLYGRMYNFQNVDTANSNSSFIPVRGKGYGRGGRGWGMRYGSMYNFQSIDTTNINKPYILGWGKGYRRGGRGFGMGPGRMYNFRNINPVNDGAPVASTRLGNSSQVQGAYYGRIYNPQTEEIIKGKVVRIDKVTSNQRMYCGIHLIVKTDKETIPVHLGPEWYFANQKIEIKEKDKLEILGSRISHDGKPAIVAAEVKKGDEILILRDEIGVPLWSSWNWRY